MLCWPVTERDEIGVLTAHKGDKTLCHTSKYLLEAFDARSSGSVVFACHTDRCYISCRAVHTFINNPYRQLAQDNRVYVLVKREAPQAKKIRTYFH